MAFTGSDALDVIIAQARIGYDKLGSDLNQVQQTLDVFGLELDKSFAQPFANALPLLGRVSGALTDFGGEMLKTGAALSTVSVPLLGLGKQAIEAYGMFERAQVGMTLFTGSMEESKKRLNELIDFAIKTPFEIPGLIKAQQMLVGFGFEAKNTIPILTTVGDALSAVGRNSQQGLENVIKALAHIANTGTLMKRELNTLALNGINAAQMVADAYGTTVQGVFGMTKAGAISSANALNAILSGMQQKYGGAMEMQSQTILGMFSNLKDAATKSLIAIGESMAPTIRQVLQFGFVVLDSMRKAAEAFGTLDDKIKLPLLGIAAVLAVSGPLMLGIGAFSLALGWIATPAGLAAGAIIILTGAIIGIGIAVLQYRPGLDAVWKAFLVDLNTLKTEISTGTIWANLMGVLSDKAAEFEKSMSKTNPNLEIFGINVTKALAATGKFFESLMDGENILTKIGKAFTDTFEALTKSSGIIGSLATGIGNAFDAIGTALKKMGEAFLDFFDLSDQWRNFRTATLIALGKLLESIESGLSGMGRYINLFVTALSTAILAPFGMLGMAVDAVMKTIAALLTDRVAAMRAIIVGLLAAIPNIGPFAAGLKLMADQFGEVFDKAMKASSGAKTFGTTIDEIKAAVKEMLAHLPKFSLALDDTAEKHGKAGKKAKDHADAVVDLTSKYYAFVGPLRDAVSPALFQAGLNAEKLQAALAAAAAELPALDAGMAGAMAKYGQDVQMFTEGTQEVVDKISGVFDALADGIPKADTAIVKTNASTQELGRTFGSTRSQADVLGSTLERIFVKDFANNITSAIMRAGSFKDAFSGILTALEKELLKFVLEGALRSLINGLGEATGATVQFGAAWTRIFGGGQGAAQTGTQAAGGAAQSSGQIAQAFSSMTSTINMVTGAISAITGVLSYLQGRRMEQDIGRIEVTSRAIQGINSMIEQHTRQMNTNIQAAPWDAMSGALSNIGDYTFEAMAKITAIEDMTRNIIIGKFDALIGALGGASITINNTGTGGPGTQGVLNVWVQNINDLIVGIGTVDTDVKIGTQTLNDSITAGTQRLWSIIGSGSQAICDSIDHLNKALLGNRYTPSTPNGVSIGSVNVAGADPSANMIGQTVMNAINAQRR